MRVGILLPVLVVMGAISFATSASYAQTHGGTGILKIKPGHRSLGMGQAGVALDQGAYSMWWNPALLAQADGIQGGISVVKLVPDLADDVYESIPKSVEILCDLS